MRRPVFLVSLTTTLALVIPGSLGSSPAAAHAGFRSSEPAAGAVLDSPPTSIRLTFSEPPEASLSTVRVSDADGIDHATDAPEAVAGDPLTLSAPIRELGQRVYMVTWRVVSSVDGHATSGTFHFGVGVLPADAGVAPVTDAPGLSALELVGRWSFLIGLVLLLGVSLGAVAGFGSSHGGGIAGVALALSSVGVIALTEAQRRTIGASYGELWPTGVGRALVGRGILVAAAGIALAASRMFVARRAVTAVMAMSGVLASAAIAVHVTAGHAAGASSNRSAALAVQWVHVAAAGAWLGGLVVLLCAIRGAASATKADKVRRFSNTALVTLVTLAVTGTLAALREIRSADELTGTIYGRAVVAKGALVLVIGAVAALNRWRHVALARQDLRPLKRAALGEAALAFAAVLLAAGLAGLSPPSVARAALAGGIEVAGHDYATSIKLVLTIQSAAPGPNRFVARVSDYDAGGQSAVDRISLRFKPLDDPGMASTTLPLEASADGSHSALGNNLAFDGRWRIDATVERDGASVLVPMTLELPGKTQPVSILRVPGEPPSFAVQLADETVVRFDVDPAKAGSNTLSIAWFDIIGSERDMTHLVLAIATGSRDAPLREQEVRRVGLGRYEAEVFLRPGPAEVTATARASDGSRLRAAFVMDVE